VSAVARRGLRIGEVAEQTGTTPRTIRYYEEIGLLPGSSARAQGQHRFFTDADVERVREILRLRDLLGLSLEQLSKLLEAESARAELRREYAETDDAARRRRILEEALGHIDNQLGLVRARRRELELFERELVHKRATVHERLEELHQ
jgi:DNA-binding transcriptional MerR regulator